MSEQEFVEDNVIDMFAYRADGWANLVTGLGVLGRDKGQSSLYFERRTLERWEIEAIYRQDAIGASIVDTLPNDMTRKWWTLKIGDSTDEGDAIDPEEANRISASVQDKLKDLRAKKEIKRGLRWARLYGGAIVVMGIKDGQEDPAEPVAENRIEDIVWMKAIHRHKVTPGPDVRDVESPLFGEPEWYDVHNFNAGESMRVHATRVLRFDGVDLPKDIKRFRNDRWGDSIYMRTRDALRDFQMSYRAAAALVHDFAQPVWGIPKLHEMIASNQEGLIQKRVVVQEFCRGVTNAVLIDSTLGETFERKPTPVAGLPELLDRQGIRLSATSGMPISLLLGMPPKGFASDDASGQDNWDDKVSSEQEETLSPEAEKLVRYVFLWKSGPTSGQVPENWSIEHNPLEQQNEKEVAETRKTVAEADKLWWEIGALSADEIANSHFTTDGFQMDVHLDTAARDEFDEVEGETQTDPTDVELEEEPTDTTDPNASDPSTAFNGGQVKALQDIIIAVGDGSIPLESAIQLVALAFPVSEAEARAMLAPAEPDDDEEEPPPAGGPPPPPPPPGTPVPPVPPPEGAPLTQPADGPVPPAEQPEDE